VITNAKDSNYCFVTKTPDNFLKLKTLISKMFDALSEKGAFDMGGEQ
jgi:hypothetical protein